MNGLDCQIFECNCKLWGRFEKWKESFCLSTPTWEAHAWSCAILPSSEREVEKRKKEFCFVYKCLCLVSEETMTHFKLRESAPMGAKENAAKDWTDPFSMPGVNMVIFVVFCFLFFVFCFDFDLSVF